MLMVMYNVFVYIQLIREYPWTAYRCGNSWNAINLFCRCNMSIFFLSFSYIKLDKFMFGKWKSSISTYSVRVLQHVQVFTCQAWQIIVCVMANVFSGLKLNVISSESKCFFIVCFRYCELCNHRFAFKPSKCLLWDYM